MDLLLERGIQEVDSSPFVWNGFTDLQGNRTLDGDDQSKSDTKNLIWLKSDLAEPNERIYWLIVKFDVN